ncbi:NAD-dependent epimerase/dehydratase family protein [Pelotalea chapellei]|uniref:NAD-dependent epimerase/dehydratase family protein n=1 Tax=Pelotalea chapellei TaxID=44671 RepID=A0ABS5UAK6_9BACT|nr:NAD-dependent epimerase/dehydratase family protein [Pelotalea chapellei]MBT1072722.1 NAD-dependent epimerase/dehydratase family protein [Pelotalea chapellei]
MSFTGKNVLITGGLGFIGSNLATRLVKLGAEVTLVDSLIPEYGGNLWNIEPVKDNVRVNISDVRDEHAMKYLVQGQDYLFNLAGQTSHVDSMNNPYPDLEINARAQLSILEACRRHNPTIKLVFASTRQMYGRPQYLPVDEKHPLAPVDINGINKMAGEWYHLLYNNVYGIRAAVLRLTNTYGPRMRVKDARQTFLGVWIRRIIEGNPILVFGDGQQLRDFSYVDDTVDAMLLAALSDQANGEIFNVGSDIPVSLKETAELLIKVANCGNYDLVPFPDDRKAIDIGDYYADDRKLRGMLGWQPSVNLEEGLRRTADYYREHHGHYWEENHGA